MHQPAAQLFRGWLKLLKDRRDEKKLQNPNGHLGIWKVFLGTCFHPWKDLCLATGKNVPVKWLPTILADF